MSSEHFCKIFNDIFLFFAGSEVQIYGSNDFFKGQGEDQTPTSPHLAHSDFVPKRKRPLSGKKEWFESLPFSHERVVASVNWSSTSIFFVDTFCKYSLLIPHASLCLVVFKSIFNICFYYNLFLFELNKEDSIERKN